jgi:hypothetical protein
MTISDLTNLVNELSTFYERKEPKPSTIELWYRLVKNIPLEPIKWIIKKIEENYDSFPKNITSALWSTYGEWQQSYPEKKSIENYFDCPDCHQGLIFAYKQIDNMNYEFVFRCSLCKQSRTKAYPLGSRKELERQGYSFWRTKPIKEKDIPF